MHAFIDTLLLSSPCTISFLALLLYPLGAKMVQQWQDLRHRGYVCAVVAFLAYVALGALVWQPQSAEDCVALVIRAFAVSALALGTSWIACSVVRFLFQATFGRVTSSLHARAAAKRARQLQEQQRRREEE